MSLPLPLHDDAYRRDLGEGLLLRWSTPDDTEALAVLHAQTFRDHADDPPRVGHVVVTRDLMSARYPLMGPTDFAVVEDMQRGGALVASACLLQQVWDYEGVRLPVGRPESVATDLAYRNRGLIRAIFALLHARSAARGDLAQGITGIAYFYRQFGYEYAVPLEGREQLSFRALPTLASRPTEPYTLRRATPDDATLVQHLYDQERAAVTLSTRTDPSFWQWVLAGRHPDSPFGFQPLMIVGADDRPCGYLLASTLRTGPSIEVCGVGLAPHLTPLDVAPALMRALWRLAPSLRARPEADNATGVTFSMPPGHPILAALRASLTPLPRPPYPWYVRVADLPAFIRQVAPALNGRLQRSTAVGYSGTLALDFYRGGLRLTFVAGALTAAAPWQRGPWDEADAGFPPLAFLQLLFGYRSLTGLYDIFPDVWATPMATALLEALFPPCHTWVIPLD